MIIETIFEPYPPDFSEHFINKKSQEKLPEKIFFLPDFENLPLSGKIQNFPALTSARLRCI